MDQFVNATDKIVVFFRKTLSQIVFIPEFARNIVFQQWAIVLCLSLLLSLLLTPQIHVTPREYKIGLIAAKDIKADRDFLVEDRASTEQKIYEATKNIRSVYDYDKEVPNQIAAKINKAFLSMGETSSNSDKSSIDASLPGVEKAPPVRSKKYFEKALGVSVTGEEFTVLQKYRFARDIAEKLTKVITVFYHKEYITNEILFSNDRNNGIMVRDMSTQNQELKNTVSSIRYIKNAEPLIGKKANILLGNEPADIKKVVISLTGKLIQPNLTFNKNATETQKRFVMSDVKPVFFQIQKDEMIVREGEKITNVVLDKLRASSTIRGEGSISRIALFLGMFFTVLSLAVMLYHPAKNYLRNKTTTTNLDLLFLSTTALLQILIVRAGMFMAEAVNRAFPLFPTEANYYAIPFAVGAMLVGVLANRHIALIFSLFSSFLIPFLFDGKISMALFSFLGSIAASYHLTNCRQRSAFFRAGFFLAFINSMAILFFALMSPGTSSALNILVKLVMGIMGGIISGILVAGIAPLIENMFDYTTDIKLLELANLNQPIFQRMIMEAPGTYHHSIVVASLVEAAAETIKANSLLAKVSAYYHDIGKMNKAQYFIENQRNGDNKHDKLSPKMSSLIIITHVKDGCDLAEKTKLGKEITSIIREHHGTSLVSFFYDKAKKDKDTSIRSLPESDFRYPGPKPQTREAGLVLLADVLEASSRALSNPTPARINNLVRERIEKVFMDGQFDECDLTVSDLNKVAESFTRILNGIFHHRIDYPDPVVKEFKNKRDNNGHTHRKSAEKN